MCYKTFPDGYTYLDKIDLQNNKKQFWLINLLSNGILILFIVIGFFIVNPVEAITGNELAFFELFFPLFMLIVGLVAYIILHELTHGVFLFAFTKVKPKFGFVGWAAHCGNSAYCDKPRYIIVALAPVILWGIVFASLNVVCSAGIWFWVIWLLQGCNIGGAAGDLFVFYKMLRYPKDILVQDTGLAMSVFRRKTAEELQKEVIK